MSRMATEQPRAVWCCSTCGAIYHKDFPRCPADGAEVVMAERDPLLGQAIGHYTIDRLVGEGGMGRVYLAHHANLPNKHYALKVLLGDHAASVAMRARFTREAERASQLDHPNVVKVVDFGQTRHGLLYIVMDYVDGPALVSLIDELPMAPARVITLSRAICKGLAYAHATGIVHRDLKPENILVSSGPDGPVPRIVDFGLALSVDQSDARLTESGMTMGTPAFAAPEQLSGKAIDHRADLYALGMTMFEMLTGGKAPFEGHILEVMSARTTRDAPRISERAPELAIPHELDDLVARLTRVRPGDRYAGAREVIEALDAVRLGPEARRSTASVAGRRARRWWLAGSALAACGAAAAAWYALAAGQGASPAPVAAIAAASSAPSAAPPVAAVTPDREAATAPGSADREAATASASADREAATAPGSADREAAAVPASADREAATASASADREAATAPAADGTASAIAAVHASASAPPASPGRVDHAPARRRHRPRPGHPASHADAAPPAAEARRIAVAPPLPVPAPPLPVPAPPPAPPGELRATIERVEVSGSLPPGAVQRAVERQRSAIARCTPESPEVVIAHFKIGEARRAQAVTVTGATGHTNDCVSAALGEVRTEDAPDVGGVDVTVEIAFVVKT